MKYIIIGARYCGTTSLEKYLKDKGWDVIRNESLFDNHKGYEEWFFKFKDRMPVIIYSEKKEHLFNFDELLKKWKQTNPVVFDLEEVKNRKDFPKLNEGSTLRGQFRHEHRTFLDSMKAVELAYYEGKLNES